MRFILHLTKPMPPFRPLYILAALLMLYLRPAAAQDTSGLAIKLVTFGVGQDIPSYWGHTALIVEDTIRQRARIYNYGLYSFGDDFVANFLRGRLIFSGGAFKVPGYLNYYRNLDRDIRVATLDISQTQKILLARRLEESVLPENRNYLYDHYYDNCSTRLRDYLNDATDGQLAAACDRPARMSLRDHTRRYTARSFWLELGLMYLMNDNIDKPIRVWDEMFLPDELEKQVLALAVTDSSGVSRPLVSDYVILHKGHHPAVPATVPAHWLPALLYGLLIGLLLLGFAWLARKNFMSWWGTCYGALQALLGLFMGLPGLILFLMSNFTEHSVTYHNENLFFIQPLFLLLVWWGARAAYGKRSAITWLNRFWWFQGALAALGLLLKLFPAFDQQNGLVLSFILPVTGAALAANIILHKSVTEIS